MGPDEDPATRQIKLHTGTGALDGVLVLQPYRSKFNYSSNRNVAHMALLSGDLNQCFR
jgi:hypothetical protein